MDDVDDWCRIIKTKHGAVLFWLEYDTEGDTDVLHQIFKYKDVCADLKVSGWEESVTQELFNHLVTQETADKVAETVIGILEPKKAPTQ